MRAATLIAELEETRRLTLDLVALATEEELRTAYHPDFSPVGWHLGHVATFEAFWVLQRAHGEPSLSARYDQLFDPRQLAKSERTQLPPCAELLTFAELVRQKTLEWIRRDAETLPDGSSELLAGLFVYHFILMHEQQHAETMATILRLRPAQRREAVAGFRGTSFALQNPAPVRRLQSSGGCAHIGENDPLVGYDNERPAHERELPPYEIDSRPVTNAEWLAFIDEGGYARRELWSEEGWRWREAEAVELPFSWTKASDGLRLKTFTGDVPLPLAHPVEGLSAYEADAYARFAGRRLPTEFEWEHAARTAQETPWIGVRCGGTRAVSEATDFIGNVWEWTASAFDGYAGFQPFPYAGYSQSYFDGAHRVMRGGSWASQQHIARKSFRNWYQPHWRAMFVGMRLGSNL